MKYKNNSEKVQKFRAFNSKMEQEVFIVKPDEVIETGTTISWEGMDLVEEKKEKEKKEKSGGKK